MNPKQEVRAEYLIIGLSLHIFGIGPSLGRGTDTSNYAPTKVLWKNQNRSQSGTLKGIVGKMKMIEKDIDGD